MEVIVIDSGSQQKESEICERFSLKYPQIRLLRTSRETLYEAWNRAIAMARGLFITNANTDDRHKTDGLEKLASELDQNSKVGLVYAEQFISNIANESFDECLARNARVMSLPEYSRAQLMKGCLTGSQPMWRRSVHDRLGVFSLKYRIAADYDIWLRIAGRYEFAKVPGPLGVFYDAPDTLSGKNNQIHVDTETFAIQKNHLADPRWPQVPGIRKKVAQKLFSRGYRYIELHQDIRSAEPFLHAAVKLDPGNLSFLKTYILRCVMRYKG